MIAGLIMKKFILKIASFGITDQHSPAIAEQIKLVNLISFLGIPICISYSILFFITGFNSVAYAFSLGLSVFILPPFLIKFLGLNIARVFVCATAPLVFGLASIFAGKDSGFYLGFLVISLPPIIVFPKLKTGLILTGITVLLMFLSIVGNIFFPPAHEIPFAMLLYVFNLFTVLVTSLTIVIIFKTELEESKGLVLEKNKEIIDSINYAKKIQYTLLADEEFLNQTLPEHFVYFQPKDIVSGDFYWATSINSGTGKKFYLAVCDSTGHGVPGAFMSLLNISFLNEAITERGIYEPHLILNHARQRLIESISNEGQQDGFDGILLCFEYSNSKEIARITYAAANNAPVLISGNNYTELNCDKMPVGKGIKLEPFQLHELRYSKGDLLCLYTDGYADQFGGPTGKKYKYKKLNQLLLDLSKGKLTAIKTELDSRFKNWKGKLEQVDDVLVIGIKL